jgi:micrococcal nuclease
MATPLLLTTRGGRTEKVRLLCVDAPESIHPDKKQNIPMGKVASLYAEERLSGKYVELEFEEHRLRGNYGRLLAYVIVDGVNFNLERSVRGYPPTIQSTDIPSATEILSKRYA